MMLSETLTKESLTIVKYSLMRSMEFLDDALVTDVDNENVLGQCLCARTSVTAGKWELN